MTDRLDKIFRARTSHNAILSLAEVDYVIAELKIARTRLEAAEAVVEPARKWRFNSQKLAEAIAAYDKVVS